MLAGQSSRHSCALSINWPLLGPTTKTTPGGKKHTHEASPRPKQADRILYSYSKLYILLFRFAELKCFKFEGLHFHVYGIVDLR